ncbi:hypothetical protein Y032_0651g1147 [Ancylostoma ceylanicum]|uniref:Uncharacterized protein n=1 Tax=Ancylostoma ceylanicum TaxID=53326 RepID=A0A016WIF0_9BILA|nr:hypothetical protein Y032_0651g1147 [Ancylostoma ceylanicum]
MRLRPRREPMQNRATGVPEKNGFERQREILGKNVSDMLASRFEFSLQPSSAKTDTSKIMRLLSVSTSKQPSFSRNAGIPPQETDPTLYYMYLRGSISHHSPVTLAGCSS